MVMSIFSVSSSVKGASESIHFIRTVKKSRCDNTQNYSHSIGHTINALPVLVIVIFIYAHAHLGINMHTDYPYFLPLRISL